MEKIYLKLLGTEYSLNHKSFEIYLSGCKAPHCKQCQNPESWSFDSGSDIDLEKIHNKIIEFDSLIDHIWILGGEPLDQDLFRFKEFARSLKQFNKKLWLWTKYEIGDIDYEILNIFNYIKSGRYRYGLDGYMTNLGIYLASSNQKITKLK